MLKFSSGAPVVFPADQQRRLESILLDFDQFLLDKEHTFVSLEGYSSKTGKNVKKKVPVVYCTDKEYKDRILARLYKLENWYQQLPLHRRYVSMLTLTTFQKGFSCYMEQYRFLMDNWLKLKEVIYKDLGGFQYVLVGEPHESGFLHFHILIFSNIRDDLAEKYRDKWANVYKAGSLQNGLKLDVSNKGCLRSAKNYLMKYVSKTLLVEPDKAKETLLGSDLVRFHEKQDEHFKLFQAIKWFMNRHDNDYRGLRTFQPSQLLGRVMSLAYDPSCTEVIWTAVYLVIWGEKHLIRGDVQPLPVHIEIPVQPFDVP